MLYSYCVQYNKSVQSDPQDFYKRLFERKNQQKVVFIFYVLLDEDEWCPDLILSLTWSWVRLNTSSPDTCTSQQSPDEFFYPFVRQNIVWPGVHVLYVLYIMSKVTISYHGTGGSTGLVTCFINFKADNKIMKKILCVHKVL